MSLEQYANEESIKQWKKFSMEIKRDFCWRGVNISQVMKLMKGEYTLCSKCDTTNCPVILWKTND